MTNRITGSAITTNATPTTVYSFNLGGTPGTYLFFPKTIAYDTTDGLSAAYSSFICVRTDGGNAHLVTSGNYFTSEEGALSAIDAAYTVDVLNNIFKLVVTGLGSPDKTIHWYSLTEYTFVS